MLYLCSNIYIHISHLIINANSTSNNEIKININNITIDQCCVGTIFAQRIVAVVIIFKIIGTTNHQIAIFKFQCYTLTREYSFGSAHYCRWMNERYHPSDRLFFMLFGVFSLRYDLCSRTRFVCVFVCIASTSIF